MSQVNIQFVCFVAAPVEQCAGPERIDAVGQTGRCGKVGLPLLFVNGHTGRHFAQLLEFWYPEIFISLQIAVVTLCCVGVDGGLVSGVAANLAPASHGRMMEQLAQEKHRAQQHAIRLQLDSDGRG